MVAGIKNLAVPQGQINASGYRDAQAVALCRISDHGLKLSRVFLLTPYTSASNIRIIKLY